MLVSWRLHHWDLQLTPWTHIGRADAVLRYVRGAERTAPFIVQLGVTLELSVVLIASWPQTQTWCRKKIRPEQKRKRRETRGCRLSCMTSLKFCASHDPSSDAPAPLLDRRRIVHFRMRSCHRLCADGFTRATGNPSSGKHPPAVNLVDLCSPQS